MSQHGGKRAGAGRKPGSRNRATIEQLGSITEIAQRHGEGAIAILAAIASDTEAPAAARVSAANAILDRGFGKPQQAVEHSNPDGSMKMPAVIQFIGVGDDDD